MDSRTDCTNSHRKECHHRVTQAPVIDHRFVFRMSLSTHTDATQFGNDENAPVADGNQAAQVSR